MLFIHLLVCSSKLFPMQEFIDYLNNKLEFSTIFLENIKEIMTLHHFKKGDILRGNTELDQRLYYLKKGAARSFYLKDGKDITFNFIFEKHLLVSIRSEFTKRSYPEIIEFLEDSEAVSIKIRPLTESRTFKDLKVASLFNQLLIDYSLFLEERVIILQHKSARERYNWLIERYPRLLQRVALGKIATFLGITPETLSRIRSEKALTQK